MMLAIDLFCGMGGWAIGLMDAGFQCIGFDIENWNYPGQLVLQDIRTLQGAQFKNACLIVASPPCQEYSYRAMPWKLAKALPPPSNELFDTCFRIQREASEAAGRYVPMVVENVQGAQKWVGRAKWHFGSYYLWGDVPALMPYTCRVPKFIIDDIKNGQRRNVAGIYQDGIKVPRQDWNNNLDGRIKNCGGSWFAVAHNTTSGCGNNPDGRKLTGIKSNGSGSCFGDYERRKLAGYVAKLSTTSSRSSARKKASMEISRIPYPLSFYIGQCYVRSSCNWTAVGECGETLRSEAAPLLG